MRRFQLGIGGNVGVGVQCEACGVMAEHTADSFYIHAILECHELDRIAGSTILLVLLILLIGDGSKMVGP